MDYSVYKISLREKVPIIGVSVVIAVGIAYLFYDSMWGIVLTPAFIVIASKIYKRKKLEERRIIITEHFIDFLKYVSTALLAGYSMENAFVEAQKELGLLHGTNSIMYREVNEMNRAVSINVPLEVVLDNFAKKVEIDDIVSFVEIFSFAKRSGGDFVKIIDSTTNRISQRFETAREIDVLLASKKLEQKIMNVIPIFILAYLKLSSAEYMGVLYRNTVGVLFMTICLGLYGGAIVLSEKIVNISV